MSYSSSLVCCVVLLQHSSFSLHYSLRASEGFSSVMTCVILLLSVLSWQLLGLCSGSSQCHPVFDEDGDINIGASLVQCAGGMSDPYQPITHVQKYLDLGISLTVEVKFTLNNLIAVNELENTITLDFFFRMWWQDIRWNLTDDFWAEVPVSVYFDGIELYPITFDVDDPLPYWRPDLHFVDVRDINEYAGLLKLRPDGQFYWSRHVVATIMQPEFDLAEYPKDTQKIAMVFESYGLTQGVMGLTFTDPPVGYVSDANGNVIFAKNPIWFHDENDYSTNVWENDYTNIPEFPRIFVALELKLGIQRAGRGILVRYALPILILLLLSAATFWADFDSRIDTTMTILLSVSALYVVIIEGIPQVGYLTTFDDWIFVMYTALAMFVVLHQIVIVLKRKTGRVPLRGCIIRSIEFVGRIFVGPMSFLYYMLTFMNPTPFLFGIFAFLLLVFIFAIGTREWGGLKKSFIEASNSIQDKLDEGEKTSHLEMIIMNAVFYKVISVDTKRYKARLSRKQRRENEMKHNLEMRARTKSEAALDSDDEEDA